MIVSVSYVKSASLLSLTVASPATLALHFGLGLLDLSFLLLFFPILTRPALTTLSTLSTFSPVFAVLTWLSITTAPAVVLLCLGGLDFEVAHDALGEAIAQPVLQHFEGLVIDVDAGGVDFGLSWPPVEPLFPLFLLDLQGNPLDRSALDTLDKMGGEPCDLVAETLGRDRGHLRKDLFVDVEVVGKLAVVFLEEHFGCPLDCLGANS